MPNITIHAVRHAQGYHNLNTANHAIPDPSLTPLGESQCATLAQQFPSPNRITHLVASPLRRTLYTCLLSFPTAVERKLHIHALPELQETSDLPCDTGSSPEKLQAEFGPDGHVELSLVTEGWNDKSTSSPWAPNAPKLEARALAARRWLRKLGQESGLEDVHIVVVTHGGYLHYFTEDWTGSNKFVGTGWQNTEFRSYTFNSETDERASLVETRSSRERRRGSETALTEAEQRQLRATAEKSWQDSGFQQQNKL